jgi:predicted TIM-barrel fold metal-dependent hydrolase
VLVSLNGVNSMMAAVDWLLSGILERHDINVILSEGGAGWIPYILERADKAFHDKRIKPNAAIGQTAKDLQIPPSELFRQHMYVCLVDEYFALRSLGDIPVDNLLWEGDYPHGDGLWPNNRTYLEKALADVSEEDATKIVETNLRKLLSV